MSNHKQFIRNLYSGLLNKINKPMNEHSIGIFGYAAIMPWTKDEDYNHYESWPNAVCLGIKFWDCACYRDALEYVPYSNLTLNEDYTIEDLFKDFVEVCTELKVQFEEPKTKPPQLRKDSFA